MPPKVDPKMKRSALCSFFFILCGLLLWSEFSFAQILNERRIRFSGLVVQGDSALGVPYVHLYITNAGVGTVTDEFGYFTLSVFEGDTIEISAIGYEPRLLRIPKRNILNYSVLINLEADLMRFEEIEIPLFASYEDFKRQFLAMEMTTKAEKNLAKNLSRDVIYEMAMAMPMSAEANFRYFMEAQVARIANRHFVPTISLLNPFAWAEFIRSIKRGDHKKPLFPKN